MKSDAPLQAAKDERPRCCVACGTPYAGGNDDLGCPVCLFRRVLEPESEEHPGIWGDGPSRPDDGRFDHYEVARCNGGAFVELGRGAMGVTYKAFDVHLGRPVTLKVISEKYLGDESAQLRFLREARAAASIRHPNVASVFHLGTTGSSYFYAMEFVEGETLENLIKRSGRLEVKLALEIATQAATGLAAVHRQKLVHRDIKPSNIMVSVEEGSTVTVKIIDLGLAKPGPGTQPAEAAISTPGSFAGSPEFASPEQFAGVGVDIRSDLYSLGVVLWEMVTGHAVFRGSPAEVMYQHQHAPLPLEQLQRIPQPVVVLLKLFLEKDPTRRFQNPTELLKVIPTIMGALDAGRRITQQKLQNMSAADSRLATRRSPAKLGPKKISVARLPVTGSDVFGREEDIAFLDGAWATQGVNVVTIVAWAGVGKSTLVNHWLRRMAAQHYRSAELVFGWSFYRQGTSGQSSSADEFLEAALAWFGDPDPRIGTAWEKGERLAKLIARRRSLLVLDGLEPLQNPPGPQEGRLREPSLQALLRELAASNTGLCVITTRLPVADLADHERTSSVLRRELEQLSGDEGAKLLHALGVKGNNADLRSASDEFGGHCLALTLLGSYLNDAYNGDIRCREEVSKRLAEDVRQGDHARRVMESYQTWFDEGPELSVLRILGLFDRPAEANAFEALVKAPSIRGLTEPLTNLSKAQSRAVVARLRRARLLAGEDPHNPGQLDTHPLVREYFGEQLRSQRADAWKECNRRLYNYYRAVAPHQPDNFREMEPLFLAVICGCNAGLCREALHEVYVPRIQRGNASFAANVLGAREALLSVLIHFFESGRWESLVEAGVEGQRLSAEDQLFILMQAGMYLTTTRGLQSPEAHICYEHAEPLCHSLHRPALLYVALIGQWRFSLLTDNLQATMQIAKRVYSLAQEQNDAALMIGAYRALTNTLYYLGDFAAARQYAISGVDIWRLGGVQSPPEEVHAPVVTCLCYEAASEWHLGDFLSSHANIVEAISLAKELNDMPALANALNWAVILGYYERNPVDVERLATELIELSTHHHFAYWRAIGIIFRGWARSTSGDVAGGIASIEDGIEYCRLNGIRGGGALALLAEALHLADRTSEAFRAIREAEALVERREEWWSAELHRLEGVFLTAMGVDNTQIEASFREAIRIAKKQTSVSLEKRAAGTYAEYRRRRASGEHGFRLPLC
jgi:serine/threonine protein kinase